jgi:four helix bundle protein
VRSKYFTGAEGSARESHKEYLHFLYIARGSLAETQYFVHLAKRLGYLAEDNYDVLATDVKSTFARLHGLIRAVQKDSLPIGNGRRRLTGRSQ